MYAVTVTFQIHAEHLDAFLPLMHENAQTSLRDERGCHRFDVCTDPDQPGTVFLYELYDDRAAFDAHLASAHFKRFDAAVSDMIAAKHIATFAEVAS
ncbi:putative quinol monooxygenase [Thalassococcus sp. S3]|uniref:putative quinol monooxygenase n=1 Tax=Thalassococcus sp. S3 TaxID=2017482 RepID=UPI0010247200|nr:putative quinol monooxygenase [Thalassococcus sp. S3]QBF29943.1 antibiotic biosynthesis monooxygenase [Thalassococcus sp. S3]